MRSRRGAAWLRLGAELAAARRASAITGLGARHGLDFDQRGRLHPASAPTAATPGPTARPTCSRQGGIPQGDYAPVPWLLSSAGWAAWIETSGPGVEFDLTATRSRSRCAPRLRPAAPAPLRRARRRRRGCARFLRETGLPALLPEWAYGHWKSRDVYEHQDDVEDDCRRLPASTSSRSTRS